MTKTLQQHFERFDYVNFNIKNDLFPLLNVSDKLEYKVFNFNRNISFEDAVKEIKEAGYEPATFSELLAWPDWNEKDLVVALGSVGEVVGDRRVPYLGRSGSERGLSINSWDGDWGADYRFLAVKQSVSLKLESESSELSPSIPLTLERIEKKLDLLLKHFNN